jgi:hypothetical protein
MLATLGGHLAALTPDERLERADAQIGDVKDLFVDAVERLANESAVDHSLGERLRLVAERLDQLREDLLPDDFDKDQLVVMFTALFEIRKLIDAAETRPALDTCDDLLVNIERIRHVLRDALDEYVTGVSNDRGLVVKELREWMPNTSWTAIAELAGVDRRTLHRWAKQSGPPARRLALVARLVAILRHAWTEPGILAWFDRPRRDLGGRKPRALLDEPVADETLIMAARSGRSQYAT